MDRSKVAAMVQPGSEEVGLESGLLLVHHVLNGAFALATRGILEDSSKRRRRRRETRSRRLLVVISSMTVVLSILLAPVY
jgi:hypothetical protein